MTNNYMRIDNQVFFFDDTDLDEIELAWERVEIYKKNFRPIAQACIYAHPKKPGPWSHLRVVGIGDPRVPWTRLGESSASTHEEPSNAGKEEPSGQDGATIEA